jgi:hypothetical protein
MSKPATKVQIRKLGDELVVALPADTVARLHWGPGDVLGVEADGSAVKLVRVETSHDRATRIADDAMKDYRVTFEPRAKS